jgi:hypothetical protein
VVGTPENAQRVTLPDASFLTSFGAMAAMASRSFGGSVIPASWNAVLL